MSLNGSSVTPKETRLRTAIRKVLRENAVEGPENQGLHSWRCQYPDRYGKCRCFEDLVTDLVSMFQEVKP